MPPTSPNSISTSFLTTSNSADLKVAPDGQSVVIVTDRADWEQNIFREDLWLYREDGHGPGNADPVDELWL